MTGSQVLTAPRARWFRRRTAPASDCCPTSRWVCPLSCWISLPGRSSLSITCIHRPTPCLSRQMRNTAISAWVQPGDGEMFHLPRLSKSVPDMGFCRCRRGCRREGGPASGDMICRRAALRSLKTHAQRCRVAKSWASDDRALQCHAYCALKNTADDQRSTQLQFGCPSQHAQHAGRPAAHRAGIYRREEVKADREQDVREAMDTG